MCCPTGLYGVNVNPELLRIATVTNNLSKHGIQVERFNLSSSPNAFARNNAIQQLVRKFGIKVLPITVVDDTIVKTGAYPSNAELKSFLNVTEDYLCMEIKTANESNPCSEGGC